MSSEAIVIQQEGRLAVNEVAQQQNMLWELMAKAMKKGEDYGVIPGCKEPSLWKAGSEKILAMFKIAVDPIVEELATPGADPYGEYRIRVHSTGKQMGSQVFVGKGLGECSSWEEKYKWRRAVNDAEFEYMEKQGLARIKFGVNFQTKKDYQVKQVRVPTADIANTILKMGKKRGQIDLTLTCTAASSIFTQDLEDMPEELAEQLSQEKAQSQSGEPVQQPQRKSQAKQEPAPAEKPEGEQIQQTGDKISDPQQKMLYAVSKQMKLSDEEIKAKLKAEFGVDHSRDLLKKDFQKYIDSVDPEFKHHTRK